MYKFILKPKKSTDWKPKESIDYIHIQLPLITP